VIIGSLAIIPKALFPLLQKANQTLTIPFTIPFFGIELKSKAIKMNTAESIILREKFIQGVNLALKRLIERTKKEDGELVISRNGKVIRVKARDLE
jgi:hypothetical protein